MKPIALSLLVAAFVVGVSAPAAKAKTRLSSFKQSPLNLGHPPQVVILGAGFAGLAIAQQLANAALHVILIDRQNHHTFQPLLHPVVIAMSSQPKWAAVPGAKVHAFALKTVGDAIAIHQQVLRCFERALQQADMSEHQG